MPASSKGVPKSEAHKLALSKIKMSKAIKEAKKHEDRSYMQDEKYKKGHSDRMKKIWELRRAGALPMPINNVEK